MAAVKINIATIHLKEFPKAKEYAQEKIKNLDKYHLHLEGLDVRLIGKKSHRGQEQDYYCELTIHVPNHKIEIVDVQRDIEKAVDRAIARAKKALVRYKEKELSKKHKAAIRSKRKIRS